MARTSPRSHSWADGTDGLGGLLLLIALLFGGATRIDVLAPLVPRLLAIGLLAWLALKGRLGIDRWTLSERLVWGTLLVVPLLQLIPLPWSLWTQLPGREYPKALFDLLGMTPMQSLSMTPDRTINGWLALIPALAIYVVAKQADSLAVERWFIMLLALSVLSALLGIAQVLSGPESVLRLYAVTNRDSSVGIFSNANHHSTFLAIGLVMLAYWYEGRRLERDVTIAMATRLIGVVAMILLFTSTLLTYSRAGLVFASLTIAGTGLWVTLGSRRAIWQIAAIVVVVLAVGGVATWQFFERPGVLEQVATDIRSEGRIGLVPVFAHMAWDQIPFGGGLGSFDPLYRAYEQPNSLGFNYLNNAHNDYAQLIIEAGLPAAAGIIYFLFWWSARSIGVLFNRHLLTSLRRRQAMASVALVAILLLHSLADYPLRGAGLSCVFALACALLSREVTAKSESSV